MLICETPEPADTMQDYEICPEVIDFGVVFMERPKMIKIKCMRGTIFESELRGIIFFGNGEQEVCCGDNECEVWFKANRLGIQDKYITASFRHQELDIRVCADVR